MGKKGGSDTTTGYKYFFSILAGICRGPVDSLFLVKADGKIFYDVPITENSTVNIYAPELFGGDKGQGGLYGNMDVFFGRFDQTIPLIAGIRTVMAGLRVSQLRGVLTTFYTGEITSNDPYPKAWSYRVRRVLKGWYKDECWYPEKAMIHLTDPSIPVSSYGPLGGYITTSSTTLVDTSGNPTSDPTAAISTVTTTYQQQTVTTYTTGAGTSTTYSVPAFYNDIQAMNPAHIIYQCVTDPDWGRGLPRELVDNVSFASAANVLYDEGFGLCMKWSQQEDIDVFVQTVIDHIGAAVYTNPITGLLSIRLLRNDYDVNALSEFDYEHGLLEVNSYQTAASDATANEVIIKYRSPVTDSDQEARAQNIALQNSLGSFFTVTKDYSGLPTSTLALKVAARELRINSGGWKRVEFKVDRRGYTIVPGDVIKITALDRGIDQLIVRIATVDHSQIKDGSITIVGTHDIYGLPLHTTQEPQMSTFQEVNRYPMPVQHINLWEATYRDMAKFAGSTYTEAYMEAPEHELAQKTCLVAIVCDKPTSASISYQVYDWLRRSAYHPEESSLNHDFQPENSLNFTSFARTRNAIGVTDTTFEITTAGIVPQTARIGGAYVICNNVNYNVSNGEEYVRLDAISVSSGGVTTVTVARGCVDTPAIPHVAGSRMWSVDESGGLDNQAYSYNDLVGIRAVTHTSLGDLDIARATGSYLGMGARSVRPYVGAGFRVNGYPRDATPSISGDLVLTWHHRNRLTQLEHLFGEDEASIPAEADTHYGVSIFPTRSGVPGDGGASLRQYEARTVTGFGDPGTTDDNMTIPLADLLTSNVITGPMRVVFQTMRLDPISGAAIRASTPVGVSYKQVVVDFDYVVDPVVPDTLTGGFNFEFDYNFDGG